MFEDLMAAALEEARQAQKEGEVPVGAVVARQGKIIVRAHNRCESQKDATAHAELLAIREASRVCGDWRLEDCTLAVTLEPCCMCAGAIVNARVGRVVFGAYDRDFGCLGSRGDVYAIGYQGEVCGGVRQEECAALLRECFRRQE